MQGVTRGGKTRRTSLPRRDMQHSCASAREESNGRNGTTAEWTTGACRDTKRQTCEDGRDHADADADADADAWHHSVNSDADLCK